MSDDATNCPQCATPVAEAPVPKAPQPAPLPPSAGSAWLNPPPGQPQHPGQMQAYPGQASYPAAQQSTDGKAIASFILGLVSLVLCLTIFSGIPAVILGHISRSSIRKSMGRLKGSVLATAGLVMGYIAIVFGTLFVGAVIWRMVRLSTDATPAASTVRTVVNSQNTYALTYPAKGYAVDLATLGPDPSGKCVGGAGTAEHACLLDNVLGNSSCRAGAWCTKGAYRFTLSTSCDGESICKNYVVVATPTSSAARGRSFCATADGVLRAEFGSPLSVPITAEECQAWPESM